LVLLCRSKEDHYASGWAHMEYSHADIRSTLEQIRVGLGSDVPRIEHPNPTADDLHMTAFTMLLSALCHGSTFPLPIAWNLWPSREHIIPSLIRSLDMSRVHPTLQRHFVKTVVEALVVQMKGTGESKVHVDSRLLRRLATLTDRESLVSAENLLNEALRHSNGQRSDRAVTLRKQYEPILANIRNRLAKRIPHHNIRSLSLSSRGTHLESDWRSAKLASTTTLVEDIEMIPKEAAETPFPLALTERRTFAFSSSQDTLLDDRGGYHRSRSGSESDLVETGFIPRKLSLRSNPIAYHRISS